MRKSLKPKSRKYTKPKKYKSKPKSRKEPKPKSRKGQKLKSRKSKHKSRKHKPKHKSRKPKPKSKHKSRKYYMDEEDKCIICFGDLASLRRGGNRFTHVNQPGCNYQVHQACMDRFMNDNVGNEDVNCPACRQPIVSYIPPAHVRRSLRREYQQSIPQREQDEQLVRQINQQDFQAYQRDLEEAGIEDEEQDLESLRDEVWMYNWSNEWTEIIEKIREDYDDETERLILNRIKELNDNIIENPDTIPEYEGMVEDQENHIYPYTRFLNEQAREMMTEYQPNRT